MQPYSMGDLSFIWGAIVFVLQFCADPVLCSSILTLGINECFERVSIGKRLNSSDVSRSIVTRTLKQCNVECERLMCNAYAFGIGPRGNGTCEMSVQLPRSPPNEDPDYDLFIRVLQCRNMTMCFKRLVNGRRLIDRYVRRTFPCDSLGRCQLACSIEREFICEGFNYRFATNGDVGNSCQLTAMPGPNLDLTLDFISDYDYDFYSRDRNAPASCGRMSFKTWNYGYVPQSRTATDNDFTLRPAVNWWQGPNGVWIPADDHIYAPKVQPRIGEEDTYKPKWNNIGYECFIRARTGFRLDRRIVVLTLNTPTLYDCELVCANEKSFLCNMLSYRYSTLPSTDNCQLGGKTIRQLNLYFDLVPDRDYDVYVRNEFSRPGCQPSRTWDSDCFERIRSGLSLDKSTVRFAVNTDSLTECELICLHIKHFTCRAFSYRYGSNRRSTYNCLLTDIPVPEMDPGKHFIQDGGCELYHRASYGHGCELDQWPFNINYPSYGGKNSFQRTPWVTISSTPSPQDFPFNYAQSSRTPTEPSTEYLPSSERSTFIDVSTTSKAKDNPFYLVPSLAFRPYVPPVKPYLPSSSRLPASPTYAPLNDKPPPSSYGPDFSRPSYTRKNDKLCYIAYGTPARLLQSAIRNSLLVVSEQECKIECSRARESSGFRCATLSYWSGHCELSDTELRDLRPGTDFAQDDTYWLFSWDFTDTRCHQLQSGPVPAPPFATSMFYPDTVWGTFTVSGTKCRQGSRCTHNSDVGIWYCPIDNGDWDYCCRPGHHCGYSEGYNYPWCYVGSISKEQWRPCSDFYYPHERSNGRALHWPISYVHSHGPPNITTVSRHQPSVVDSFFESLQHSTNQRESRNFNTSEDSLIPISTVPSLPSNTSSSVLLEFQVVDVTENQKAVHSTNTDQAPATSNLWIWERSTIGSNNATIPNNRHLSNLKRYYYEDTGNVKSKHNLRKRSPNLT